MSTLVTPQVGHLDAALSNFSKGFRQNGLIADALCPRVGVPRQGDKYYVWGREGQQIKGTTLRAPGAPAARKRISLSTNPYFCQSHAQACELPDESGVEVPSLRQGRVQFLTGLILLEKEVNCASMLTNAASFGGNTVALAGATQFSDPASDPIGVVEDAKNAILGSGVQANTMTITPPVLRALKKHPAIVERFKYVQAGAIGLVELASVFNIERVLLAAGVTADDAGAPSFIWGKDIFIGYVQDTAGDMDLSVAKTFVWEGAPGTIGGIGTVIGRHPDPTAKSEIVGVDFYYDQKITAAEAGYVIKAAVA